MAVVTTLVAFGLRQVLDGSADKVADRLESWFSDPGMDLHRAIDRANEHTWHTVALALGGKGWIDWLRGWFHRPEVRGLRDQVQAFLHQQGVGFEGLPGKFRRDCLNELQRLQRKQQLSIESISVAGVSRKASDFRRFIDPRELAAEAQQAVRGLAGELVETAPNLARLLQMSLGDGVPLIVVAFNFFLRQELAGKQSLTNGLLLNSTEQLNLNVQLVLHRLHEQEERGRLERAELQEVARTLLEAARGGELSAPSTLVPDAATQEKDDRLAVEALLNRSPLTAQVRQLMDQALEDEFAQRRSTQRDGRAAGTPRVGELDIMFVWIPSGTQTLGSPRHEPGRHEDEELRQVTISRGFWLSAYPVTWKQWCALIPTSNDSHLLDDYPVEGVSWHDCEKFLNRLRNLSGERYRLPTEAEWEYACRAGTATAFAFGARLSCDQANFDGRAFHEGLSCHPAANREGTTTVGLFPPNLWGLYDMHGNVMEWCLDWYEPHPAEDEDPCGLEGETKVLRGGAWQSLVRACRSANRYAANPDTNELPSGFRIVQVSSS